MRVRVLAKLAAFGLTLGLGFGWFARDLIALAQCGAIY